MEKKRKMIAFYWSRKTEKMRFQGFLENKQNTGCRPCANAAYTSKGARLISILGRLLNGLLEHGRSWKQQRLLPVLWYNE